MQVVHRIVFIVSWLSLKMATAQHLPANLMAENWQQELIKAEQLQFSSLQKNSPGTHVPDNYNLVYERLQFRLDPNIDSISGSIDFYFYPGIIFRNMIFDCSDSLTVDSVIYHNQPMAFSRDTPDILNIQFPQAITNGILDSIKIVYHGSPLHGPGFGAFVQSTHAGHGIIWTLSEPYGAKNWMPCKQSLNDKIDSLDIFITCPDSFSTASNGILVHQTHLGNKAIYHWKHRYPIATYLIALACTNYSQYYDYYKNMDGDTLPIMNLVYPEYESVFREGSARMLPVMKFYEEKFGVYPFTKEKYGHAQFGWGGGMEHQTHTFVAGYNYGLLNHELAHQWFGDKVTCPSWSQIWLNESFATYCAALADLYVAHDTATWEAFKYKAVVDVLDHENGSVFVYDTTDVARIFSGRFSYGKGAMVLHQLRTLMGDEKFFRAIKNYLEDASCEYKFGSTKLLQQYFELQYGSSLETYFQQWIYEKDYPNYDIKWWQNENWEVVIQVQQFSQSKTGVYQLHVFLNLEYWDDLGKHDSLLQVPITEAIQRIRLPFYHRVGAVVFNPGFNFIARGTVKKDVLVDYHFGTELIQVTPQPAQNELQLISNTLDCRNYIVRDYTGRIIIDNTKLGFYPQFLNGPYRTNIDISKLAAGYYFVEVMNTPIRFRKQFIKQ